MIQMQKSTILEEMEGFHMLILVEMVLVEEEAAAAVGTVAVEAVPLAVQVGPVTVDPSALSRAPSLRISKEYEVVAAL